MDRPVSKASFPWRMAAAYQFMSAFAQNPPKDKKLYRRTVGLCMALLGQFMIDEDDESILAVAKNSEAELAGLSQILNSPRQNVLSDMIERLAAHGPVILPELIAALQQEEFFWPRVRALDAITRLAQLYPGSADPAVPVILDQIQEDESDYVLEAAGKALRAIGPAVVQPAMERIDLEDFTTYDIYIFGALGEIPTEASVKAFLDYHERAGEVEEFAVETMAGLAHPHTLPLLRSYYQEDPDPNLAEFCYTVAYLNQIDDPLFEQWRAESIENREKQQSIMENLAEDWASGKARKREKPEKQPWENFLASALARSPEESRFVDRAEEREKIERVRKKEAARQAEAKAKAKRKQEKMSRKKSRKRK
jgi:hypothetical protein